MSDTPRPLVLRGATLSRWPEPDRVADVVIAGGVVASVGGPASSVPPGAGVVELDGWRLAAGYVDLQVNGGGGVDLASAPERVGEVAAGLVRHGVTSFCPTLVSSPPANIEAAITSWGRQATAAGGGATVLGSHLEGPLLAPERRGAHRGAHLRAVGTTDTSRWRRDVGVRVVTLAPELPGAPDLIARLSADGVAVLAGHTSATFEEMTAAADVGLAGVTHLFNAMAPFGHRQPGPVGAALVDERLRAGLIVDGHHLHAAAMRLAWTVLGPRRCVLVSDAVAAQGLGDGAHRLGSRDVVVTDGAVRDADGHLAGSLGTLDAAVRRLVDTAGCHPSAAIHAASAGPCDLVGESHRGRLGPGAVADLVVLDDVLGVQATLVAGRVVHAAPNGPLTLDA